MSFLDLDRAQQLIGQALAIGREQFARPICVAICDAQGFLVAFARQSGAPLRSIAIAQGKAYTCARMGTDTDAFLARLRRDDIQPSYFCDDRLTALPGGAVLKNAQGEILGGIGISGLTSAEDQVIAHAVAAQAAAEAGAPTRQR